MELQERALGAAMSIAGDERALAAVVLPHDALVASGDITRFGRCQPIRPGTDRARIPRRPDLGALDLLQEQRERAFHDDARVSVWDLPAEQGLEPTQAVVTLLADGELDAVPLRGSVLDDGTTCRWRSRDWLGRDVYGGDGPWSLTGGTRAHCARRGTRDGNGKLPDGRRDIGPRRKLRDQCLDLTPAAAAGLGEYGLAVLGREVLVEQADGRQRHRARRQRFEDRRKTAAGLRDRDAVARGILRQAERLRAVSEE